MKYCKLCNTIIPYISPDDPCRCEKRLYAIFANHPDPEKTGYLTSGGKPTHVAGYEITFTTLEYATAFLEMHGYVNSTNACEKHAYVCDAPSDHSKTIRDNNARL